uniref:Uncharacterized protein n=1 Tax=Rousettus aegyptiacus TaxID=9407 RepID=A0A7J8JFT7_ROUAE|nr:hypothetical protein HJG63_010133 [Rousettus aegyptiacus]
MKAIGFARFRFYLNPLGFFFLLTTFLRYNLHNTQVTLLKCMHLWFLVYVQFCNYHRHPILEHFYHPRKKPCAHSMLLLPPRPTPPPHEATTDLLSVSRFAYSGHVILIESCNTWSSVTGFFRST